MAIFKPGDKVVVIGDVPQFVTAMTGVRGGCVGEVMKMCSCPLQEFVEEIAQKRPDFPEHMKKILLKMKMVRVSFEFGKGCVPDEVLRKIYDEPEQDKMVDWSKVPKPWEIGVTDAKKKMN